MSNEPNFVSVYIWSLNAHASCKAKIGISSQFPSGDVRISFYNLFLALFPRVMVQFSESQSTDGSGQLL
jgi:hypothetical protein